MICVGKTFLPTAFWFIKRSFMFIADFLEVADTQTSVSSNSLDISQD